MMKHVKQSIRKEAVAGSFYPDNESKIIDFISFVETSRVAVIQNILISLKGQKVNGLIVPHAGWIYSGKTALLAYKILETIKPSRIAMLGPSHQFPINRVLSDSHDHWSTPLGPIKIHKDHYFESNDTYHAHEHALEVQTPFIKYYSGISEMLPLVIGGITESQAEDCARHLYNHHYFVIISTDLSHFNSLEMAKKKDAVSIGSIQDLNDQNLDACGTNPLKVAFEFCKLCNSKPQLIEYSTSAEITGDKRNVVGYASFWF